MGYRYIGSKARIAEDIINYLGKGPGRFVDAFSGTGVVAECAADMGWSVHVNDMMKNAVVMSEARLVSVSDINFSHTGGYADTISYLNELKGEEGFIWEEYSPASVKKCGIERKYFSETNAMKIDAVSTTIHKWYKEKTISSKEFSLLISDLIKAVNNVANIAGTYGCFLSKWTKQSFNPLLIEKSVLREQAVDYTVSNCDVYSVPNTQNDVVYLDPPYTKRQYASYYHILETLALGDRPVVEGVSGLRPWKEKASVFCYKVKALSALLSLITGLKANRVLLSYSNEGHVILDDLVAGLSPYGEVSIIKLGEIGRYRPNRVAVEKNSEVQEYLIDFRRN